MLLITYLQSVAQIILFLNEMHLHDNPNDSIVYENKNMPSNRIFNLFVVILSLQSNVSLFMYKIEMMFTKKKTITLYTTVFSHSKAVKKYKNHISM